MISDTTALFWFRRDLRHEDNVGLMQALRAHRRVHCVFVFDRDILDLLSGEDRRVEFIWHTVRELHASLVARGGGLMVLHERAVRAIPELAIRLNVQAVYANGDYEPAALARDEAVDRALKVHGIGFRVFKDQVVFERNEVLTGAGQPYLVFTPYRNAWLKHLDQAGISPARPDFRHLVSPSPGFDLPSLESMGFCTTNLVLLGVQPGESGARSTLQDFLPRMSRYHEMRDYPGRRGVSYLSVHLRFGTVSIRHLVALALADPGPGAKIWLSELIWREFYFSILFHFPHVVSSAFKPHYDALQFDNDPSDHEAWKSGQTGYPLVDAAMRQLNSTGYMHNRLRMVAASFLVKDLGVDWRWGEQYFASQLNDFDLAANNGGWQWAASTGCDAQPWFRIFNPVTQSQRFDPAGMFIRRHVPELAQVPDAHIHAPWRMSSMEQQVSGCRIGQDYPAPRVDHAVARERTLKRYARVRPVPGQV